MILSLERFLNPIFKEKIRAYLAKDEFANEDLFQTYLSYFPSPLPEHSLEKRFPLIASEWNYQKNFPLTPKNFSAGSNQSVWWICPEGHDYDMQIYVRALNGSNCPYCAGKRVDNTNSLSTLFPDLAKQFNNEKNYPLTPSNVSAGSGKIVWWTCKNEHNFQNTIAARTGRQRGCPYCSKRKPSISNNLKIAFPWINEIWDHEKNLDKKPENFTPKSKKKVWLKCAKGHSYEKIVQNIKEGENCPYCLKVKPSPQYNLRIIHPETSQRWCAEKNAISTDQILPASGQKFWWECPKGHRYQRPVYTEVKSGRCPICKN